jgi:hypothetical protein
VKDITGLDKNPWHELIPTRRLVVHIPTATVRIGEHVTLGGREYEADNFRDSPEAGMVEVALREITVEEKLEQS